LAKLQVQVQRDERDQPGLRGAMMLDPGADRGVAVEEVQGDPSAGGQVAEGDRARRP
jgi:hypothetical protein